MPAPAPRLVIMRHAPAEALTPHHHDDAARRLSPEGRRSMQAAGTALARLLPLPARIYTSPLARARETAELLAAMLGTAAPVATPRLAPGFARAALVRELAAARLEPLALVGHEPDLSGFVGWLLGGDAPPSVEFAKGTVCVTELAVPGSARLLAHYPLDALVRLARD